MLHNPPPVQSNPCHIVDYCTMSCHVESKYRTCDTLGPARYSETPKARLHKETSGRGGEQQITTVSAQAGPQHWHFAWFAWFAWPLLIARAWPGLGAPF